MSLDRPRDAWLLPVLETMLPGPTVAELRRVATRSLWETAVLEGLLSDDEILAAASSRFRVPIADLQEVDDRAVAMLPERWARRLGVLPLRVREGSLEVAAGVPHDAEGERALAFA